MQTQARPAGTAPTAAAPPTFAPAKTDQARVTPVPYAAAANVLTLTQLRARPRPGLPPWSRRFPGA
jgi:hypothetical protein